MWSTEAFFISSTSGAEDGLVVKTTDFKVGGCRFESSVGPSYKTITVCTCACACPKQITNKKSNVTLFFFCQNCSSWVFFSFFFYFCVKSVNISQKNLNQIAIWLREGVLNPNFVGSRPTMGRLVCFIQELWHCCHKIVLFIYLFLSQVTSHKSKFKSWKPSESKVESFLRVSQPRLESSNLRLESDNGPFKEMWLSEK